MVTKKKKVVKESVKEPWLTKGQKYIVFFIGLFTLIGIVWSSTSKAVDKADSRYAKAVEVKKLSTDVAMLGKAFQYDQLGRAISEKQDVVIKINLRLKEKIDNKERESLEEIKRKTEFEIERLKEKQKKFEPAD